MYVYGDRVETNKMFFFLKLFIRNIQFVPAGTISTRDERKQIKYKTKKIKIQHLELTTALTL